MINNFENSEFDYFNGKVPDKTYVSKRIVSKFPEFASGQSFQK